MLKHCQCQSARLYRRPSTTGYKESDSVSLPGVERSGRERNQEMEIIKIYSLCLGSEMKYKSLKISSDTTVKEVVLNVLQKYRMLDKDPNLFYLTLELWDSNITPAKKG